VHKIQPIRGETQIANKKARNFEILARNQWKNSHWSEQSYIK